ncbi:MAG: HAMP domain-containing histidine kinase [Leptolyngbyaceae cyanobacterium CSU_1_4]|nr:HAMP domain-containing histidine kinase [Leptolyngbyaceae cyanobacterium CSU_1_4]
MTFIQHRFKQLRRLKREGIGSLQLRLTLGITVVSLLGLGSLGTWTIWEMRQMLLVKHKQSLELIADRFPDGLEQPTSKSAMTQTLQHKVDQWASPSLWIWVKVEDKIVAQSPSIAPMEPLFSRLTMPALPAVYNLDNHYWVFCSRTLQAKGMKVGQLYLAQDITHDYIVLSTLINTLRVATLVAIAIIAVLAALLIWRSLHPLRRMNQLAAAGMELDQVPTEVKDLVQAFSQLSVRLSETGAQQRQFTDSMSHELRTSLSLIYGYLQSTLRRGDNLTDPQKNALEVAVGETERTIQLLTSLLDLAKSNQGGISLHCVPLNLNDWLQITPWMVESQAFSCLFSCRLSVEVASDPLVVQADSEKLQQVIQQLIDNAAQYSEPDRPIALVLSRDRQEAVIQVHDHGFGIPALEHTRIFEPFYRLESSRCRSTGGMGLGLAIVKSLTESMGGRVTVQSTWGEGSVFEVRLPIKVAKP